MAGTCGGTIVKLLLALFNFVWLGIGVFLIYLGIQTIELRGEEIEKVIKTNVSTGAIVLIVFGAAVVLIATIGFLGACCESSSLLNFYGLILFIVLVVNIVGLYYGYQYQEEFREKLETGIKNGVSKFKQDPQLAYGLQKIQSLLHCCGWEGPGDYSAIIATSVPASCCKESYSTANPTNECSRLNVVYSDGCKHSPIVSALLGNIIYSAYALILVQLVVILSACCLARDLNARN